MFAKFATVVLAVATFAAAQSQCNTGSIQCCNQQGTNSDPEIAKELGLIGVVVQGVDVLVGLNCSPITVIGAAGSSCSQQAVCCQNDQFNGVVAVGCTPINVNA